MIDQQALSRVLRAFARTMAGSYDVTEALYDLSDNMVEVLGADAAGVALLVGESLRFVTATSEQATEAEGVQEELQSGPCLTSIERNGPVAVPDLRDQGDRWPEYAPRVEEIGFRAVLGLPLVLDDRRVGSLDVYSVEPRRWDEEAVDAGLALADIGAAYVLNASQFAQSQRTAAQLQSALESRVVIEQAKGAVSARLGVTTDQAFHRLRSSARGEGLKLAEVCRRVLDTDYLPD